jgi:hypothetical protein
MKKLVALVVVLLALIGAAWIAFAADYSDGYRVGQVIKLSRSGYVFKTWEGTLDFGFLRHWAQPPGCGISASATAMTRCARPSTMRSRPMRR